MDTSSSLPTVVIGLLGTTLDRGVAGPRRWERWRPTVALFQQDDLEIARLELLHSATWRQLAAGVVTDIALVSPATEVVAHAVEFEDPWDFEPVYAALHDWAANYPFKPEEFQYLVHISTGTHVAQICLYLLVEAGFIPGKLVQTAPPNATRSWQVIDLDLARYDRIARRSAARRAETLGFLKGGIETKNQAFNTLIDRIERVVVASDAPVLLLGPTGAGKSQLARRIVELKRARRRVRGALVEVNCATVRGDSAMSALFGHVRGAFTGAGADRKGLLLAADGGVLFLDEIGELGDDEQAMLLRAIEEKRFLPLGSDREVASDFQLIAGTNRDLVSLARDGKFRADLLARIDLWSFRLPGLAERPEDLEPNLDHELARFEAQTGRRVRFNREARTRFLAFGREAPWPGNFRDLAAVVTRLATLADGGRIDVAQVDDEIARLRHTWGGEAAVGPSAEVLSPEAFAELDPFDRVQLDAVLTVCRGARSLSEAGRQLFAASRERKTSRNDADRLRKYLATFGLSWELVR